MAGSDTPATWTVASVDIRRLKYFLATVDHGGIGRAAQALLVAQPSLSQAIKTLEREVGTALFERRGRGLALTAAGHALIAPARQLLRDAAAATAAAQDVARLHAGWLQIVALPTLAVDPLAELTGRFRARHPNVGLDVVAPADADDVVERVRAGDSELGLTLLPGVHEDLRHYELAPQHFDVVLPPGSKPGTGRRVTIDAAALDQLDWVITPPATSTRALLDQAMADSGGEVRIAVETDDREAIVPLVLAGAGATLLPRSMARQAADRGALVRAVRPPLVRRVGLLYRAQTLSEPARAFMAAASAPS